ncbi:hypothetical protein GUITHDRAFT_143831 [Guillardia theta CCMP2712]|uniref:Uncharacterized protein n=1 Tax=Guillardia theta (strain CCMP2712) TaxID=905079 RepID=L1IS09_GUITC|nr:hypothetical protein GUITHDRAFT_143831 [Guillardia theta CCMP2712]EKX39028.1 hypothetical protein GUITHDRAFT_143831 [Guillardia theta CCMP2712]|eukprot:XP_005826008.1 hypothetical protein GUITHDRAFT_143831 [Guillardia theta CCMP2712]
MFWRGFASTSTVDLLLDSENCTLEELLKDQDLIQECKQRNQKLLNFLSNPTELEALVGYVVDPAPEDADELRRIVFPCKASEILSLNSALQVLLLNDESLTSKLMNMIAQGDDKFNEFTASNYSKVHENSSLALVTLVCAVDFLLSKTLGENESLADCDEKRASVLKCGLQVVLEFVRQGHKLNEGQDDEPFNFEFDDVFCRTPSSIPKKQVRGDTGGVQKSQAFNVALKQIMLRIRDVILILKNPPRLQKIVNSVTTIDPPLGSVRFKIVELIHLLVLLDNIDVYSALAEHEAIPICLQLFFQYEWHNMLHNLVQKILEFVVHSEECLILQRTIFEEADFLNRVVKAYALNESYSKQPKTSRKGYMGHLRVICNMIMQASSSNRMIESHVSEPFWKKFLEENPEILVDFKDSKQGLAPNSIEREVDGQELEDGDFESGVASAASLTEAFDNEDSVVIEDQIEEQRSDMHAESYCPASDPSNMERASRIQLNPTDMQKISGKIAAKVEIAVRMDGDMPVATAQDVGIAGHGLFRGLEGLREK